MELISIQLYFVPVLCIHTGYLIYNILFFTYISNMEILNWKCEISRSMSILSINILYITWSLLMHICKYSINIIKKNITVIKGEEWIRNIKHVIINTTYNLFLKHCRYRSPLKIIYRFSKMFFVEATVILSNSWTYLKSCVINLCLTCAKHKQIN